MKRSIAGSEVYVHTGGRPFDPDQRAMVLLHGAGFDHTVWRHQSRYLAHRGWSVAAIDFPGHGRSGGEPLDSVEELAAWTLALLGELGSSDVVLVGHSMGSLVGLEIGDRGPVRGRVLLSGTSELRVHPDLLSLSDDGDDAVLALLRAWEHASHPGGSPTPGTWIKGEGWRLREGIGLDVLHADLVACHTYDGGPSAASSLVSPVLLLGGAGDRMIPVRASAALAEMLADVEVVTVEGAGHALFVERPRRVAREIERFGSLVLPA